MCLHGADEVCVGDQAAAKAGHLRMGYPIKAGLIPYWDQMEKVWQHTFESELRVVLSADEEDDEDVCGVLMTEDTIRSEAEKQGREKTIEMMFEKSKTRRFYLNSSQVQSCL